ncbi:hypothetical protein [Roseomonas chloroacetimidivorans]
MTRSLPAVPRFQVDCIRTEFQFRLLPEEGRGMEIQACNEGVG